MQTKLTLQQYEELLALREEMQNCMVFHFPDEMKPKTIAIMPEFPGSNFARVSIAYCSETEKEYLYEVGEYLARIRLWAGTCIKVPDASDTFVFYDIAEFFSKL